jgi:gluconate 2-dehydrogenase gamma chain
VSRKPQTGNDDTLEPVERGGLTRRTLLARAGVLAAGAELGMSTLAACGDNGSHGGALGGDIHNREAGYLPPLRPAGAAIYSFFTASEAETVDAIIGRLIPGTADDPGAREAGVLTYIDTKLAQFATFSVPTYFHPPFANLVNHPVGPQEHSTKQINVEKGELPRYGFQSSLTPQDSYQKGLVLLDRYTKRRYRKRFIHLADGVKDDLLKKMEAGKINYFQEPTSQGFFAMILEDAYEGMFADPEYGGNRNFAGWRLIGYPGAQRAYTAYELQHGPQHKRVQGLRDMPPMNPGRLADSAIMPLEGTRLLANGGQ